jgi:hypothetical protein
MNDLRDWCSIHKTHTRRAVASGPLLGTFVMMSSAFANWTIYTKAALQLESDLITAVLPWYKWSSWQKHCSSCMRACTYVCLHIYCTYACMYARKHICM